MLRALIISNEWDAATRSRAPSVANQVRAFDPSRVDVDRMGFPGFSDPRAFVSARRALRTRLGSGSHDLVHAEHGHCALLVLPSPVPIVVTVHESDLNAEDAPRARRQLLRHLNRAVSRRVDAVIAPSASTAGFLPSSVRTDVIPWGIDLEDFLPRDAGDARRDLGLPLDRRLVLVSCGPFSGPGFERYERAVEALIQLRAELDVSFVNVESREPGTMSRYLNASDVLLVTGAFAGWEARIAQALASGVPVVVAGLDTTFQADFASRVTRSADTPDAIATSLRSALMGGVAPDLTPDLNAQLDERTSAARVLDLYERVAIRR